MNLYDDVQEPSRSQFRDQQKKHQKYMKKITIFSKRLSDIVFSLLLLILFAPLLLGIIFFIYKKEGRPIFRRQLIAGKNKRSFMMWTFRIKTRPSKVITSLPHTRSSSNEKVKYFQKSIQIYTVTGYWLKKLKLYKLPLLFNVLKGDMSFIGPKPLTVNVFRSHDPFQLRRLTMRPGMMSYENSPTKPLANDLYYIYHWSLLFDLKIVYRTMWQMIKKYHPVIKSNQ